MSNFQQRDMNGVLFKNDKGDNPARPDYRGELVIDGRTYELSSWIKDGQKGKFMSLSVKPKEQQQPTRTQQRAAPQSRSGGHHDDADGDIPFRQMAAGRAFLAM